MVLIQENRKTNDFLEYPVFRGDLFMRLIVLCVTLGMLLQAQNSPPRRPLTIEDVIRQVKSGISEEIIVTNIKKSGKSFDLSTEEILELKRSGVSEAVIKIMVDPSQPYSPPPPPQPSGVSPQEAVRKPMNPLAEKVPPESGVYLAEGDSEEEIVRIPFRTITAARSGKASGLLTGGLKKSPIVGYLVGSQARTQIPSPSPVFYLRLPEKVTIEEVLLLVLAAKADRREVELGPNVGKPVFPVGTVKPYESKQIDVGLYRITVGSLTPGEYLFFLPGSADEKKGIVGKGYDFSVEKVTRVQPADRK
jgi:hypothetical protein